MSDDEEEKLWGEIPFNPATDEYQFTQLERESFLQIIQAIAEKPCPVVPREMFVPPGTSKKMYWSVACPDKITMHAIELQKYICKMEKLLASSEGMEFDDAESAQAELAPSPPLPPMDDDCILLKRRPGDITGRDRELSDFANGKKTKEQDILPFDIIRHQQQVACSATLAKIGIFTGSSNTFDVYMDVVHEFFLKFTALLRRNVDQEAVTGNSVFMDVMEKTFQEMGFGSITSLHDFYQETVVDHHDHLLEQCHSLIEEYEKRRNPTPEPEDPTVDTLEACTSSDIVFPEAESQEDESRSSEYEDCQGALQNDEPTDSLRVSSLNWPATSTNLLEGSDSEKGVPPNECSSTSSDILPHLQTIDSNEPVPSLIADSTDNRRNNKQDGKRKRLRL